MKGPWAKWHRSWHKSVSAGLLGMLLVLLLAASVWALPVDTDNDGLPNGYESTRGTNVALADTDGDGRDDAFEVLHGLNPLGPDTIAPLTLTVVSNLLGRPAESAANDLFFRIDTNAIGAGSSVSVALHRDYDGDGSLDSEDAWPLAVEIVGDNRNYDLEIFHNDSNAATKAITTWFTGLYGSSWVAPGKYFLRVTDAYGQTAQQSVTVVYPDAPFTPAGTVSGTVTDGVAVVANATVSLLVADGDEMQPVSFAFTDAAGNYTIQLPAPLTGSFSLAATRQGLVPSPFVSATLPGTFGPGTGSLTGKNLALAQPTATIIGQVIDNLTGAPVANAPVFAEFDGREVEGFTDSYGNYSLPVLADQSWWVEVDPTPSHYAILVNNATLSEGMAVVPGAAGPGLVDFKAFRTMAWFQVAAYTEDYAPVVDADVWATPLSTDNVGTQGATDTTGEVTVGVGVDIDAGEWTVGANAGGQGLVGQAAAQQSVAIAETLPLSFTFYRQDGAISGSVVYSGTPATSAGNVEVEIYTPAGKNGANQTSVGPLQVLGWTNGAGNFTLPAVGGVWQVQAHDWSGNLHSQVVMATVTSDGDHVVEPGETVTLASPLVLQYGTAWHCENGVMDADETAVDSGGACGSDWSVNDYYEFWPFDPIAFAATYINWTMEQHGPVATGSYLKIDGFYYYVVNAGSGTFYDGDGFLWPGSGPGFAWAELVMCDQNTGEPLLDEFTGGYLNAPVSLLVGYQIELSAGVEPDGDGVFQNDNCPVDYNPDQANADGDYFGDACDDDDDNDGIADGADNCQYLANPSQANSDGDAYGDACDPDNDNDTILNAIDNCPVTFNPAQSDLDGDGQGDACDPDIDGDTRANATDNCPYIANADQANFDGDALGDVCDADDDNDAILDSDDNCPLNANYDQADADGDDLGDVCDPDDDNDGIQDGADNCPYVANADQANSDGDAQGDACDPDDDNDTVLDGADNCPVTFNPDQFDSDGDGAGDFCDADDDNDGVLDGADNCQYVPNATQLNFDGDALGDACDPDDDNDGLNDGVDNCPLNADPDQTNTDGDSMGNICDPDDDNDGDLDAADNCPLNANPDQLDTDNDAFGDACDSACQNPDVAPGLSHAVALLANRTARKTGDNSYNQLNIDAWPWSSIINVAAGDRHTVGLKLDGTVVGAGSNASGQLNVGSWMGIKKIYARGNGTFGLTGSRTVVTTYTSANLMYAATSWSRIVNLALGQDYVLGLTSTGYARFAGSNAGGIYVSGWKNLTAIAAGSYHAVGLEEDRTVVASGWNGYGQLNVASWTNIVAVAAGSTFTVGLKSDGTVVTAGTAPALTGWTGINAIWARDGNVFGLKSNGTLLVAGPLATSPLANLKVGIPAPDLDGNNLPDGCYPLDDSDGDGDPDSGDVCPDDFDNDLDEDGLCAGIGFMAGVKLGDNDPCPSDSGNDADGDLICRGPEFMPPMLGGLDPCPSDAANDADSDGYCAGGTFQTPMLGASDNCPDMHNPDQLDTDLDGQGNACDADDDNDGVADGADAFPLDASEWQDSDGDGAGDNGDLCPDDAANDADNDGYCAGTGYFAPTKNGDRDNCPDTHNPDQLDTDLDGQGDVCDADDDGDGVLDGSDNCALIANADQLDTDLDGQGNACDADDDGDGVLDGNDNCALTVNADQLDTDLDGQGNVCDADDDGDGHLDHEDVFPLNGSEWQDSDGDGVGDNSDVCPNDSLDDLDEDKICAGSGFRAPMEGDNDSCPNDFYNNIDGDAFCGDVDVCPNDPANDADEDGICVGLNFRYPKIAGGDSCPNDPGNDVDSDSVCHAVDNCPVNANPGQEDFDNDGLGDVCDPDDDNDGYNDGIDAFPYNVAEWLDSDGDGTGDNADACPLDAQNDADRDGVCGNIDNCPASANPGQENFDNDGLGDICDPDDDNDGYNDGVDAFPYNAAEWLDSDNDGTGDNGDICPLDPQNDVDSDGVCGNLDNCPDVANAGQENFDNDGMGDACDADDDNDGHIDTEDAFPFNAAEWLDSDGDGLGDNGDACPLDPQNDADSDGVCGNLDNCPDVANASQDNFDNDAMGDACDVDDDNDGHIDTEDAFPFDPAEWLDTDGDGTGNVADTDDDGDGLSDAWEALHALDPLDNTGMNGAAGDPDGDGFTNAQELAATTDPRNPDTDGDGLLDGADPLPLEPQAPAPGIPNVPPTSTGNQVSLSWAASTLGGVTYTVQEASDAGFTMNVREFSGIAGTSTTLTNNTVGTYYYQVKAVKAGYTDSSWARSGSGCEVVLNADAPTGLNAPQVSTTGNITLSWTKSATAGAGYELQESTVAGDFSGKPPVLLGDVSSYNYSEKAPGTYYYRIRAVLNPYQPSDWVEWDGGWPVVMTGSVAINAGAATTNTAAVTLNLAATSSAPITQMRVSKDNISWYAWEPYAATKGISLNNTDGIKYAYAQFMDANGYISQVYSDDILLASPPSNGVVVINSGAATTNTNLVNVFLSVSDNDGAVPEMQLSKDNITWFNWEPFVSNRSIGLATGPGTKALYVRFRDTAGNVSAIYSDTIYLDDVPPTGSVVINGGAATTASSSVTLTLSASDGEGPVTQMQLSKDNINWYAWEPYSTTKNISLLTGDGLKVIYVRFKDAAGNTTLVWDYITSTQSPTGSVLINSGAATTKSNVVNLFLTATDNDGPVPYMRISKDNVTWFAWEPFVANKTVSLTTDTGTKYVYIQYKDVAGNISSTYSDSIILDVTPPTGSVVINNNAYKTNSLSATLTLSATDDRGAVTQMRLSKDGVTWFGWESYVTSKTITLPTTGTAKKTIYVEFKDAAGNVKQVFDSIYYYADGTPPTGSVSINNGAATTTTAAVTLNITATDAASAITKMRLSKDNVTWYAWEPYATTKSFNLLTGLGTRYVYIQFQDASENDSIVYQDTIDVVAP